MRLSSHILCNGCSGKGKHFSGLQLAFRTFYIPIRVVDGQVHMYIYPYLILGQATYTTCTTRSGLINAVIFTLAVSHY